MVVSGIADQRWAELQDRLVAVGFTQEAHRQEAWWHAARLRR